MPDSKWTNPDKPKGKGKGNSKTVNKTSYRAPKYTTGNHVNGDVKNSYSKTKGK